MNYPQPPYPPQPGYAQQPPAPGYAPQAPGYYQPPPGYPPQQYPQQQYAPPPQAPVLARGTLEDYLDQPTGGGGAATSKFFTPQRPVGSWLHLRVARDLINSDVRQQTDKFGTPLTFKSTGKPKFVLIIPCQVLASNDGSHQNIYPEGQVTVWLKGVPSDAFKGAMLKAGVTNPDRALVNGHLGGAEFYMVGAGTKQFGNGNPANMFDFQYMPNGREMQENAPATPPPGYQEQYYEQQAAPPIAGVTNPAAVPPTPAPAPAVIPPPAVAPGPPAPDPNSYAAAYQQATGQPFQPPAPPTAPPAPPAAAYPPPAPGAPPAGPPSPVQAQQAPAPPPGYGQPGLPQMDPEKAALLQRLQGQQQ